MSRFEDGESEDRDVSPALTVGASLAALTVTVTTPEALSPSGSAADQVKWASPLKFRFDAVG